MTASPAQPVFTIGYGLRERRELIDLLHAHNIEFVADVRSVPYSRRQEFSRAPLEQALREAGIRYVFFGDTLGGRPDDESCYDAEGHVDYERCRSNGTFAAGIERIRNASLQGHRLALMCSEARPTDCHRSKLLAEMLVERGVHVVHVDEQGNPVEHGEIAARLRGPQLSLVPDGLGRSRRSYRAA